MKALGRSELGVLVRFEVASRFRDGGDPIDSALAKLYYRANNGRAVPADVVRRLLDGGYLGLPSAGHYVVTSVGRRAIEKALAKVKP